MKTIHNPPRLVYLIAFYSLVISCSNDDLSSAVEENLYELKTIDFYLTDDDQNTFSYENMDTLTYTNHSNSSLTDTVVRPFASQKDTLLIKINTPTKDFQLKNALAFRNMMIHPDHTIGYLSKDSISFTYELLCYVLFCFYYLNYIIFSKH